MKPEMADLRPKRPNLWSARAKLRLECANFRPKRANFRPEMWGTTILTNEQTEEQIKVPMFYRTLSPFELLPKKNLKKVTDA